MGRLLPSKSGRLPIIRAFFFVGLQKNFSSPAIIFFSLNAHNFSPEWEQLLGLIGFLECKEFFRFPINGIAQPY